MTNPLYFRQNRSILQLAQRMPAIFANGTFTVFLLLALCTPAWRVGPFTWWTVWQSAHPYGNPAQIGLLSLLPVVCVLAWGVDRLADRQRQSWQWGSATLTLPLLVLSLLILRSLQPALNERTLVQVIALVLFWFSYLYALNKRPPLTLLLSIVVLVQAGVALAQFGLQRELGLAFLGELSLDPHVRGTSVLWSSSQIAWMRGYGLTAHPNVLGVTLAVLLLVLLPGLRELRGWRQMGLAAVLAVGALGLLVSFSRTAWLAFLGGLLYWALRRNALRSLWAQRGVWLPFLVVPVFLLIYYDLIFSRLFHLESVIEARSLYERVRDAQTAWQLIVAHPWLGVGAGNGLAAAQAVHPDAGSVHSVPLLVMVELGALGGICWLLFMALPLLRSASLSLWRRPPASAHPYAAVWVGVLIAGLFDTPLWFTTSWRAALLLGLLAALQTQNNALVKVPGTFCSNGSVDKVPASEVREVPGTFFQTSDDGKGEA
ncbi:MAG: O-antigen ligase domain-containing protein [Chloroflexi bacterium]|nr:MAG: O-antigen ligase domain-containing protein [Chloroflexota bacterium]